MNDNSITVTLDNVFIFDADLISTSPKVGNTVVINKKYNGSVIKSEPVRFFCQVSDSDYKELNSVKEYTVDIIG